MKELADYVLMDQLQSGNHGTFYLARPPSRLRLTDEVVAIKILDRHATDNEFKRMAAELKVLLDLSHPRLVDVVDAGHDNGRLYYATRYYEDGGMTAGPCHDLAAVLTQIADAAEAAHALHQIGVAHRDIKPANILLAGGRGHLSDLGVANYADAHFTATGSSPVGTLTYSDPRLIHGDRAGPSSDVWSLGATLHMVVTGESVLGDIPNAHLAAAIEYVLAATVMISASCPADVASVVDRATNLEPANRHSSAAELAVELRTLAGFYRRVPDQGLDVPAPQPTPPPPSASPIGGDVGAFEFDDGRRFTIATDAILGREPGTHDRVKDGTAVPFALDSEPTMSRAHLLVTVDGAEVAVTDLSANGTELRRAGMAAAELLPPGQAVPISDGDALLVGQRIATYRLQP